MSYTINVCIKEPLEESTARHVLKKAQLKGKRMRDEIYTCERCGKVHLGKRK